ncbi:hypothetical protein L3X38_022388 [Prunus dulcis]|uniref:Cyclic nucleotide-binding domain-containing protein n=1 Tax=Prunus dulcis TaxID=3755 RepID=A0AAD4Z4J5_PRUDU|nr:hypothetical protein L3X38_022388 [Prunus dulcis]
MNHEEVGFELLKQHNQPTFEGKVIQEFLEGIVGDQMNSFKDDTYEYVDFLESFWAESLAAEDIWYVPEGSDIINIYFFGVGRFNIKAKVLWTTYLRGGGSGHLGQIVTVNIFLFLYYVARIVLIRIYSQKVKYQYNIGIWFRASFNFFFYMVASNVLGGFWYFFSIQREISCRQSCRNGAGCRATYYCSDSTPRDITFLDELCPVNPQNAAIFNFGIFLEAIQSGITRSENFPTKFFYCVWWGIRNLSNFGTNLQTSSYVWETCFAIVISITGLLLFLYLIGNVQIYMQHVKTKSLEDEEKTKKLKEKTISKRRQIRGWMIDHGIPLDEARNIMQQIKYHKLVDDINADEEVDVKYIFSVLYDSGRNLLQHHLCMETLKQVDHLRNMDEKMVKIICDHMKLKTFDDKEYIIEAEKPLEVMMIIVEGFGQVYPSTRHAAAEAPSAQTFKEGDILGRELVDWAAMTTHDRPLISFQTVQCLTKVAAFVLKIEDLKRLVISKRIIFRRN